MNYYETLYIVHPTLESGRLKDLFKDHPAWGTLIVKAKNNYYKLDID